MVYERIPDWAPVARSRAHELVIQAIEDQIMAGALVVGDPLPPERELAARLEVSRAGVREAVRVLEGQGVLRSRVGSGADAGTFVAALPDGALTRFLRLHVALANFPFSDVVDARVTLERSSAALAARNADAAAIAVIGEALQRGAASDVSPDAFNDADTAFHVAIAEATGNRLVSSMTIAIRESLTARILTALHGHADWTGLAKRLHAQHEELFDAIVRHEPEVAAELAEHHIRFADQELPRMA
ncbi:FadR/GntR family transcriptional regulator [Microbacterium sp. 18062]|uniref:FadR/GntR family transcriptional regulator n=1 Tax=Microbacterium sp. 18062 TaxID=2681410 RepID=UPI001F3A0E39|nr:FCD domain-containing protein [Microbacterium sp. 18062]